MVAGLREMDSINRGPSTPTGPAHCPRHYKTVWPIFSKA